MGAIGPRLDAGFLLFPEIVQVAVYPFYHAKKNRRGFANWKFMQ